MKVIKLEQALPVSIEEAWDFFATPRNLNLITPENMTFEILSEIPDTMYEGLMIHYRIRPFFQIPMNWSTEITHISDHAYFVDEQRTGPYRIWHHEHHFKKSNDGVLMTDILHYDIGWSLAGKLAGLLLVDRRVEEIFQYRRKKLEQLFARKPRV